jgi:hypothetical protein
LKPTRTSNLTVLSSDASSAVTNSFTALTFCFGCLRQMGGVPTTHEAGIGRLAERAAEHPGIEGGSLGFGDGLPGVTGMSSTTEATAAGSQTHFRAESD